MSSRGECIDIPISVQLQHEDAIRNRILELFPIQVPTNFRLVELNIVRPAESAAPELQEQMYQNIPMALVICIALEKVADYEIEIDPDSAVLQVVKKESSISYAQHDTSDPLDILRIKTNSHLATLISYIASLI